MIAAAFATAAVWAFVLVLLVWLAVRWHARQPRTACKHSTSKLRLDSQRRIVCSCGVLLVDIDTRLIDERLGVELRGRVRDELRAKLDSIAHERPRITTST